MTSVHARKFEQERQDTHRGGRPKQVSNRLRRRPPPSGAGREPVSHRCYTSAMPTKRRRHAITETPAVAAALDELRAEQGSDRVEFGELVVLGATLKTEQLRAGREETAAARSRLADRVRARAAGADPDLADEVRQRGWTR
jgi:hypothetical protein